MPLYPGTADYIQNVQNIKTARFVVEKAGSNCVRQTPYIIAFYARRQLAFFGIEIPELIEDFLLQEGFSRDIEQSHTEAQSVFSGDFDFSTGEDILGFLYMMLSPLKKRKKRGAYYTKSSIAKSMIQKIDLKNKTLADICCGTGIFLLEAVKNSGLCENLYGYDSDPIAVFITRINMLSLCGKNCLQTVLKNISCLDTLIHRPEAKFDIVIGNPPWGYRFDEQKSVILRRKYTLASKKGRIESFKLFMESSVALLQNAGILAVVLPESLLTVKMHRDARKFLLQNGSLTHITYWGNTFRGVLCPSISLTFVKNKPAGHVNVVTCTDSYTVKTPMSEKTFNYHITDSCAKIIDAVYNSRDYTTLKNNARFAMGIVTGNNKKYIFNKEKENREPIFRGKDIEPFTFLPPKYFIEFKPELYQQTAPSSLFRQAKIAYRFVSKSLICTFDETGSLLLNSANFFVPNGFYSSKIIACFFNSDLYTFLYQNLFNAAKVLRSHMESLPLPVLTDGEKDMFERLYEYMKTDFDRELLNHTMNSFFHL